MGKALYLIINQIDKHREAELSFEQYRRSVEEAFAGWNIVPDGILYLSLRQPDHPHNEFSKLVWLLDRLMKEAEPLRDWSVRRSALHLVAQHATYLTDSNREEKLSLQQAADAEQGREIRFQLFTTS
ncbi:hypothetical protein N6H14_30120 [Paenibacillus sp. CC-CFT747]|nr:hypothetical protein N6H14_30120 [Paenibacillus sp. CC-CFT747]